MNGALNVNPTTQVGATVDPCGVNVNAVPTTYLPSVGFGQTQFIRFSHPDAALGGVSDATTSISLYATDAFAAFRNKVWDSLDESGDITTFSNPTGANILDTDNPACVFPAGSPSGDGVFRTDLSGYLTIDVVNYCTNFFPDSGQFYDKDAIATLGWGPTYTPNVLIGDIFYVDTATQGGNISGDPAIAIEFDSRLTPPATTNTFFGKFPVEASTCQPAETTGTGCASYIASYAPSFIFAGDGREPLGDHYGFRYLADAGNGLQTWMVAWRSDIYTDPVSGVDVNLCTWLANGGPAGSGLYDAVHQLTVTIYDTDENPFQTSVPGGPSGGGIPSLVNLYLFLETQRVNLLLTSDLNPSAFKGGWIDIALRGPGYTDANPTGGFYNQGYIGVQHTAPGAFLSVGYSATNLNDQFQCVPNVMDSTGNEVVLE
jgi:hypothetical protein